MKKKIIEEVKAVRFFFYGSTYGPKMKIREMKNYFFKFQNNVKLVTF